MFWGIISTLAAAATFVGIDRQLVLAGARKPYYAVHVLHNAMIVALTAGDVWACFYDIGSVLYRPISWPAIYLCYGLHAYHIYEYWRSFHADDWLHHALMIGVALPLGSSVRSGALMGLSLFFMTGLPGGINYALLFAERNGWVSRATEKAVNVPVHQWLRGPGCVASAALTWALTMSNIHATQWDRFAAAVIATLTFWNGIYFTNQVARALSRPAGAEADENSTGHTPARAPVAPL